MSVRQESLQALSEAVSELDEPEVKRIVKNELSKDVSVIEIFEQGLKKGLDIVGQRYETGEYALGELAYAGSLVGRILEKLKPYLEEAKISQKGSIIMGAVRGDIHDIGKNIVKMLMICRGWKVHDLGVDVPASVFVDKVEELKPDILGLTSLLTTTTDQYGEVIEKLKQRNLRNIVKVVIAGNAASEEIQNRIGADGTATNAEDGIRKCEELLKK